MATSSRDQAKTALMGRPRTSVELESLLLVSEERFRAVFDSSTAAIALADLDGCYRMVNSSFCDIIGYSASDLVGKDFLELTHPDDIVLSRHFMEEVLAGPVRRVRFTTRYLHKHGHIVWTDVSIAAVCNADGQPAYLLTHFNDVSALVLAQRALEDETEELAATLRCIGDGVVATDTAGRVTMVNDAARQLTGWGDDEARGLPVASVFEVTDEFTRTPRDHFVEEVLTAGQRIEVPDHLLLADRSGDEHRIAVTGAPIEDGRGMAAGVVLVFRDMTEHRKLEEATERIQRIEALGVLAMGIAHDFNNLLTGIYGNLQLARLASSTEEVGEHLDATIGTLSRARSLTQQLQTFAKGGKSSATTGRLQPFLRDTVRFALSGSRVTASYSLPDDLWPCDFDSARLGQAIDNLVINAVQAMPRGGSLSVSAENAELETDQHPGLPAGRYIAITLSDTGVGIAPEILSKVFDPLFTTKDTGSGLGLAVVLSIVKQHGGTVEVDSEPGGGSSFHVMLPASNGGSESGANSNQTGAADVAIETGSGRILAMDDEATIRSLYQLMLPQLGYDTVCARDGQEAVRMLAAESAAGKPFNAVILDLTVSGGMGGLETLAAIRKLDASIPVFLASGYAGGPVISDPNTLGFSGGIGKPFTLAELAGLLRPVSRGSDKGRTRDH